MLADRVGFHAFWTVEHHFLEEFSHCSNPEVLYGAVSHEKVMQTIELMGKHVLPELT